MEKTSYSIERKPKTMFVLYEFKNVNELPSLKSFKVYCDRETVIISFGKTIRAKIIEKVFEDFSEWVNDPVDQKGYKTVWKRSAEIPLSILIPIAVSRLKKGDESPHGVSFESSLQITTSFKWFAPIRVKAQRLYYGFYNDYNSEGSHVPFKLAEIFERKNDKIIRKLNEFGKDSSLYDDVKVERIGKKKFDPFDIVFSLNKTPIKLNNTGYGVSQILPIIVEIAATDNEWFLIQQPEVHLHPKAQSAFGKYVFDSFVESRNQFVIETHSDFTIDRFRYHMKTFKVDSKKEKEVKTDKKEGEKEVKKPNAQLVFFERSDGKIKTTTIKIDENGKYEDVPLKLREFFLKESIRLMGI